MYRLSKEELKNIIKLDPYHKDRQSPTDAEVRLFLREVDYHCPLCGKELQYRDQIKPEQKLFEIAHIYPNSPTVEQYVNFKGLRRLGKNCESYENKIALCKECHPTQDFHTTAQEYIQLVEIKEKCLLESELNAATRDLYLEDQIELILTKLSCVQDEELSELSFEPKYLKNKFYINEVSIKRKIKNYVVEYYPFIRDILKEMDGKNGFHQNILAEQIRSCFIKINDKTQDKEIIFQHLVQWIKNKTLCSSNIACEIIVSFFVQNCEVFYEISE
ncbi:MAG: hypothetical protein IJW24_03770 [Clostridia bacterium]|nr:hypothetical protein [Clostridia bacterium]